MFLVAFQTLPVHAVSSGFERYKDKNCEIYLEYFPIVAYDSTYPTASEEFPITFHLWQRSYSHGLIGEVKRFPRGFEIMVYYRDDSCGYSEYVTWKTWYPTSTKQYGLSLSWSLSGAYGPLTISQTFNAPTVFGYDTNYDEYYEKYGRKSYRHLSDLSATYRSNYAWGSTDVYGAGNIAIRNDMAQDHQGHDVLIWVHVMLYWLDYEILFGHYTDVYRHFDFVLGDDTPADTDCWLTVEQGGVNHVGLTVLAEDQYHNTLTSGYVYIGDEFVGRTGSTFSVPKGTHSVLVTGFFESGNTGYRYDFTNWKDGSTDNPRTITVDKDTEITANFYKKYCPCDINGDGKCTASDMLVLRVVLTKLMLGEITIEEAFKEYSYCDVNGDGKINVSDMLILKIELNKSM